ncbi:MAG: hypothetical protein ACFB3T_00045 [Geminicoccaceae bacterium]
MNASDLAAIVMLLVLLPLPLVLRRIVDPRHALPLLAIYVASLATHVVVSFYNAYVDTLIGAGQDAVTFHRVASENAGRGLWQPGIGADLYETTLQILYASFGSSLFLGQALTIATTALAFVYLCLIARHLKIERVFVLFVLFAFLPSKILFFSITLRDVFEMTFLIVGVYYGLRWRQSQNNGHLTLMLASLVFAGLWHHAFLAFTMAAALLLVLWPQRWHNAGDGSARRTALGLAVMLALMFVGFGALIGLLSYVTALPGGQTISSLVAGDSERLLTKAEAVRRHLSAERPRTDYGADNGIVLQFIYYLFKPFPWEIRGLSDLVAGMEAILRFILLACAFHYVLSGRGRWRGTPGMLLTLYLGAALFWSLGTSNYGNGSRHHLTHFWLLCLVAAPALQGHLERSIRRSREPRRALASNASAIRGGAEHHRHGSAR